MKTTDIRNQALAFALAIAERDGVQGLREEISRRGIANISLLVPSREYCEAKAEMMLNASILMQALCLSILNKHFDFGKLEADRFRRLMDEEAERIIAAGVKGKNELIDEVNEKLGINLSKIKEKK